MRLRPVTVILIGCGNIGSQLAPLLCRLGGIDYMVVIDPGSYDESNLPTQNILPGHVGKPKAEALAAVLRSTNPGLQVLSQAMPVQEVPVGCLQGTLIVCCVDNRRARQYINQIASRIGVPWLDTAVDGDQQLARIALYVPDKTAPCLECAWSRDGEYAHLDARYSCLGEVNEPSAATASPTGATAELGAFTAALACMETRKVLAGDTSLAGQQLFFDARFHRQFQARLPYNENCLFDHGRWQIEGLTQTPDEMLLSDAFALASADSNAVAIRQEGQSFVRRLRCVDCGRPGNRLLHLSDRLQPWQRQCHRCGGRRQAAGFDQEPVLVAADVSPNWMVKPMSGLGYRRGDVFSLVDGDRERHFRLGAAF